MIRYSTPWALNASKSCFRSSGRIIVCTLERVGGSGRVPYRSKPFAHRTALPVPVDFCLLFLMAGESTDCLVYVHAEYLHSYYIPFRFWTILFYTVQSSAISPFTLSN